MTGGDDNDLTFIREHLHLLSPSGRRKAQLLIDLCDRLNESDESARCQTR